MQVEEAYEMVPATTLYFSEKYDLGATHLDSTFRKVSLVKALIFLVRSKADVLEVPEPLWVRFLPMNVLLLIAWKLSGWMRRRSRFVVTYAIENNDLSNLLTPKIKLADPIVRLASTLIGALICCTIDRIAYGSAGSMEIYHSLAGVRDIPHRVVEELPAATAHTTSMTNDQRAIFIGELDDRKGILDVIEAWPGVESELPEAVLTIVGAGPYSQVVPTWCSERPSSRRYLGFLSHAQVKHALRHADVLVAPSRRLGRWREQIGLPITEALSHGLTVVTTDETGLATWLAVNGHVVVEENCVPQQLSSSIIEALKNPLQKTSIQQSLPAIPGRIEADKWLHAQ